MNIKDYNTKDTIAAIATFPEKSALGVIKISGEKALAVTARIFAPAKKKNIKKVPSFTVHYGWIREGKKVLDEVLVTVMRAPASYTRDDVVEISSHGGIIVLNRIMELLVSLGIRPALPGEFTYRAFVNGRIDLFQAQAVMDIVQAQSDDGLEVALAQARGEVSLKIKELRARLKKIFELWEAALQFPDENLMISPEALKKEVSGLKPEIRKLVLASEEADFLRRGLRCVLCGRANSGKSTLFNCLLKEERVIVTRIAGTTRDVIEETIQVNGVPLKIYDTAGILEPGDLIEKKALEKSYQKIAEADIILLLLDGSRSLSRDDRFLLEKVKDKNTVIVINKIDLELKLDLDKLKRYKKPLVKISALKHKRILFLEKAISRIIYRRGVAKEDLLFLSLRQKSILQSIQKSIDELENYLEKGYTLDFAVLTLRRMLTDLGRISGEVSAQEVLEDIFSDFCIGK